MNYLKIKLADNRTITVEKSIDGYEVWYGHPGRRLRVGAGLTSLAEAQKLGRSVVESLHRHHSFVETWA